MSYPGDAFFKSDSKLTLQLHSFDLSINRKPAASAAPVITWHVPGTLAKAWLVQLQVGCQPPRRTKALQFAGWRSALAILSGAMQPGARLCL
jgi:hypothetical protein